MTTRRNPRMASRQTALAEFILPTAPSHQAMSSRPTGVPQESRTAREACSWPAACRIRGAERGIGMAERQPESRRLEDSRASRTGIILLIPGGDCESLPAFFHYDGKPDPCGGGLTRPQALWMGVPVVTLPGTPFAGRHARTYVVNAGFPDPAARNEDESVCIAASLAADLARLAALRYRPRQTMANFPVCDSQRFVRDSCTALNAIS